MAFDRCSIKDYLLTYLTVDDSCSTAKRWVQWSWYTWPLFTLPCLLAREVVSCVRLQPQSSIPDVVIWMICDGKRIASYRCPAHLLLWSSNPECRGKYCGLLESYQLVVSTAVHSGFLWLESCRSNYCCHVRFYELLQTRTVRYAKSFTL